jgi:hypothetical protein
VRVPRFAVRPVMVTSSGTLIVRWNGSVWKRVPSPGSAASTSKINHGSSETLILHWNGTTWK